MGVNDGTVLGATKILNNGEDTDRFNIVLVAEGYQDHEQNTFDSACEDFVKAIKTLPWFSTLINTINIHKINYKYLSISIILILIILTASFSGLYGLLILTVSSILGLTCILFGVRRTHLMGALLLPVILFYLI